MTKTLCGRLLTFFALGLGLVGSIACLAAILGLWSVSARARHAAEVVFAKIDDSLVIVQERTKQAAERVKASAITTESIASSLKDWTRQEAGQRLAEQLNLVENSDKVRLAMQQADNWLEVSGSAAELVQQALMMGSAIGAEIDTGFVDGLIEDIGSIRNQLAEASEVVERLRDRAVALAEEDTSKERIEQAAKLGLRVIATLGAVDSRLEKFQDRLAGARQNLQDTKARTLRWIRLAAIAVAALILWMAAGQGALCYLAWNGLRSPNMPR